MKTFARAAALALIFAASSAYADIAGRVVGVIDGDTLDVLVDKRPVRVRLAQIDAPEKRQAFGTRARQALSSLTRRQPAESRLRRLHPAAGRLLTIGDSMTTWPARPRHQSEPGPEPGFLMATASEIQGGPVVTIGRNRCQGRDRRPQPGAQRRDRARMPAKRTLDADGVPPPSRQGCRESYPLHPCPPARAGSPEGQRPFGQGRSPRSQGRAYGGRRCRPV